MSSGNRLFTKSKYGFTEAHHHLLSPPPPPPLDTSRVIQVNSSRSSQSSRKCQQMSHGVTAVTVAGMIVPLHIRELVRELRLHYPFWRQMPPERKVGVVAKIG
nr:hypothetical protein [Tanacetum cinerariifolium]